MNAISFNVRYEPKSDELAFAYVNDTFVGRVKYINGGVRFRCTQNPWTNDVPKFHIDESYYKFSLKCLAEENPKDWVTIKLIQGLTPIVIRNYLRNWGGWLPSEEAAA